MTEPAEPVQQIHTLDKDTIDYFTEIRVNPNADDRFVFRYEVWVTFAGEHSHMVFGTHHRMAAEGVKGFWENNAPMAYDWYYRLMSPDLVPEVTFGIDKDGDRTQ